MIKLAIYHFNILEYQKPPVQQWFTISLPNARFLVWMIQFLSLVPVVMLPEFLGFDPGAVAAFNVGVGPFFLINRG